MADSDVELEPTDGVTLEIWTMEATVSVHQQVKTFAAKLTNPHAHGQWLICDFQTHEKSNNKKWKGFEKVFRMKYKPTKFAHQHVMVMSSSNDTDSPEETWGHAMDVLRLTCNSDVYVYHAHLERKKRVAGRAGGKR
jgi:hypothetical protein